MIIHHDAPNENFASVTKFTNDLKRILQKRGKGWGDDVLEGLVVLLE